MSDDLPASGQRRTVLDAAPSEHLADVGLSTLRTYRERLREEEEKISYWRRLIHARVDLIRAGDLSAALVDAEQLGRVLGDTGSGHVRAALHRVRAADPLPDLPDLDAVWESPHGDVEEAEVIARLAAAEHRLTDYRRALHERIDEATAELIVRYRAEPTRVLDLLAY